MRLYGVFVLLSALTLMSGCTSPKSYYNPIRPPSRPLTPRSSAALELVLETRPAKDAEDLAIVGGTGGDYGSTDAAMQQLRSRAAAEGADGAHTVRCAPPGEYPKCEGIAFIYKQPK
jgi:hypothetical protein